METTVVSKLAVRLVPFLFLLYIVAYLDRINVGFAALQMQAQLGLNDRVYGLGAGLFFAGYFFFQVPSNLALERIGARRWISTLMILWGCVSSSMMFVRTPREFYALRFLLGVAEAGFFPGIIFYFTQWYPATRRGKVTALFMSAIAICSMIGSVVSGSIMQTFDGANGWAGWQWLFLLEAAPAVLIGFCVLIWASDNIAGVPWLNQEEKRLLAADLAREAQARIRLVEIYNATVKCFDGTLGWAAHAPYDAILVAAGGPSVPEPLIAQLKLGGRLVVPVGVSREAQRLVRVIKTEKGNREEDHGGCAFVPLIGQHGWSER